MKYFLNKPFVQNIIVVTVLTVQSITVAQAQPAVDVKSNMQFMPYDESKATVINAKRGFATHIKLESNEHITEVAGGDSAGWEIVATKGNNDIFMKPKSSAHDTNLVVATDRRSYAFDLRILSDRSSEIATWHLAFTYAKPVTELPPLTAAQIEVLNKAKVKTLQAAPQPKKNTQYSMQVMPASDEIAPTAAWDDGTFTYLRIPNHREIPTVFRVTADGTESMVNTHMEGDNKDTIVIHGVAKRYVLRLSSQVVGIWNDAYDIEGVSPKNGTVTLGVTRKVME